MFIGIEAATRTCARQTRLGPVQKVRDNGGTGLAEGLAGAEIAVVGENNPTLIAVNRERALG